MTKRAAGVFLALSLLWTTGVAAQTATTEIKVKDGGSPSRNRELLENAIDLANRSGVVRPIVIPAIAGGFAVDRPVFAFGPNLDIRGSNPDTILRGNGGFPPLVLGIHPEPGCQDGSLPPGPRKWTPDHWVDAKGKVDASLAPESGKWFGLRSFSKDGPDTVVAFPHSPFTNPRGKSWSDIPSVTLDVGYEGDKANPAHIQVLGASEGAKLRPLYLKTTDAAGVLAHEVDFETTDGVVRWFRFPLGAAGLRRVSIHIDLPKANVLVWFDGVQVPVDGRGLGEDFTPGNTLRFADAAQSAFKLNGLGFGLDKYQDSFGGPARHTFYWLRLAEGCPYRNDGVGAKQVLADGRPVDDEARAVGHRSPGLLAYLDLATRITDARLVRWVGVRPESSAGYGLALLGQNHCHPFNTATRVRLSDLDLRSGGPETYPWGAGIWAGGSIGGGYRFERCRFWGGQDGFGGLMAGAAYPVIMRDCTYRGTRGNSLTIHFATVKVVGQTIVEYPARNGIVAVRSNLDIDGLFMSECGKECRTAFSMLKGGRLTVRDFMVDTEYNPSPTEAVFLAERSVSGDFPSTRFSLSDGTVDGGAKGVPLVKLMDVTDEVRFPAYFEVKGLTRWRPENGPLVQKVGGKFWRVAGAE